ncbi:MAG: peptidylprolyl isomerase [Deltaproteobacteria bacterium]|nr:peptidylprolyl isomerase [Deltaproteobacteria bacterium]
MATERVWAVGVVLASAMAGCPRPPPPAAPARAVATVDGQPISALDLRRELWRVHGKPEPGDASRQPLAEALLDHMIEEKVLAAAAVAAGITVTPQQLEAQWESARDGYRMEDFQATLYAQMQTPELVKARLRDRLLVEKFLEERTRDQPKITDDEVKRYYEAQPARWRVPQQVRARQIVVRTVEEARPLLERLHKGEDFARLAREHSVAPEKDRGGDLGFFPRGVMPEVFDRTCFALEVGQVSDVITSEYGQHIFQVTEKRAEQLRPLSVVDAEIRDVLRQARRQDVEDRLIRELRMKAVVVRDDDALRWAADAEGVAQDGAVAAPGGG